MKRDVLIIGGGPAGLAAAIRLSERSYGVTLLEQRSELGGRLIQADSGAGHDALPLVLMGYQQATLSFLKTLGTANLVQSGRHLRLEFLLPDRRIVRLPRPFAPAPAHAILGFLAFRGLPFSDRFRFLNWLERTWEGDLPLPADLESRTADEWLISSSQSGVARAQAWGPLTRFLIGEEPARVSAAMLIATLSRCFLVARHNSSLAIPSSGIHDLLVEPAQEKLKRAGARIVLEATVEQIRFNSHCITGVRLRTGECLTADWYLAALPHRQLTPLLPERALTRFAYFQQLTRLCDIPALAIHLRLERPIPAPKVLLLAGRPFHWLVSRTGGIAETRLRTVSLVATGQSGLHGRPDQELLELALHEIADIFPSPVKTRAEEYRIVRAPQAFLSVGPGTNTLRPLQQSPFPNLLLAGDWTDTGLPPTLESAILSGNLCADAIADKR